MRPGILCLLTVIGCGLMLSCSDQTGTPQKSTITVIPKGTTHLFWQSIHAGAIKAAKELGVDVVWVGPEKEDDRQQQIALVDNQIISQVDGIVLAPLDDQALLRPVKAAVDKNIPVVIIDSDLLNAEDLYVSFVATDNREGGRIAARELSRLLDGKGRVMMLRCQEGSASTENREAGFLEEIAKSPGVEVASSEQYGGATVAQALQASENLLMRFRDGAESISVDGVFSSNESTTYGMLQALRRHRLAGKVKFVGFDTAEPLLEGIRQGEIDGLVAQNPFKMGYLGVKTMIQHLRGETVPKRIDTGVAFVTRENLDRPETREFINPDVATWLSQE